MPNIKYQISKKLPRLDIGNWKLDIGNSRMRRAGFTIIELILVFAIMGIIGSVGIASFSSYSQGQQLKTSSLGLVNMLNSARSRSYSQVKPSQCQSQKLSGYQVSLDIITGQYNLSAVCGNTYSLDSKKLPANISFAPGSARYIFFPILIGAPPAFLSIGISGYGKTIGVTIDTGGNISTSETFTAVVNSIIPTPTSCPWWDCMIFSTPKPTSIIAPTPTPTIRLSPTPTSIIIPTPTPTVRPSPTPTRAPTPTPTPRCSWWSC